MLIAIEGIDDFIREYVTKKLAHPLRKILREKSKFLRLPYKNIDSLNPEDRARSLALDLRRFFCSENRIEDVLQPKRLYIANRYVWSFFAYSMAMIGKDKTFRILHPNCTLEPKMVILLDVSSNIASNRLHNRAFDSDMLDKVSSYYKMISRHGHCIGLEFHPRISISQIKPKIIHIDCDNISKEEVFQSVLSYIVNNIPLHLLNNSWMSSVIKYKRET